jgi:hypothetical protein
MAVPSIVKVIEGSAPAEWMRMSLLSMPVVEAIHVMTAAVVFGTILIVDLRLLGFPSTSRPFTRIEHEILRYTWGAFIISVVTGILMFSANATTYYGNTAFRLKMLALLVAGVNMAVFELVIKRGVASWDKDVAPARAARFAGAASIVIWTAVIFIARWIAWTKGYSAGESIPDNLNFDFSTQ